VISLMDALDIDDAHVVGISMGGVISQLMAARCGKRVRSLTSVMSASRSIDPAVIADLWTLPKPREEAIEEWVEYMHTYGSKAMLADDDYYRQQAAAAYDRGYAPDGANRQILAICATPNVSELVRTISVPTLVVHGAGDLLIPPEAGRETAQLIPDAKFELIEGMGHDIPPALGQPLSAVIISHIRSVDED
jgi:pimeloyl-ACP methyl ester carboxylesterase